MASGTSSVAPVGQNPGGPGLFKLIGEKVKKAKEQAVEARQEADQRIKNLEEIPDDEKTQDDIIELDSLKQKRSENAYFFKKALKFQATDKIRTTMGKFQRDPELQNDPAATEKERFYAKSGMFRPGEMPDTSDREGGKDVVSYVGKGFQLIMDAIDKIKSRVNKTASSSEQTASTASSTESKTDGVKNSTENLNKTTETISNVSKEEVNVQQMELDFEQKAEQERNRAESEARSEAQSDTAGVTDVKETDQGIKPKGKGLFSSILNIGGQLLSGRGGGRLGGLGGRGGALGRLGRMRAGRMMNPARRNRQYTAPIGPQPMNSPTPWAAEGGGFTPRMPSSNINLSDGGIIAPIKAQKQKKLADGGITGLVSKFLPPPLGPMLNMMINPGGAMGGIGNAVKGAAGGAFQMLTNPTKLIGDGLRAVLPMNRNVGKQVMGNKKETENISQLFKLPNIIGGGIMFSSIAQIANAVPFLGAIINAAKPIIKPLVEAFGLPASVLGIIFGGGSASAATMPEPVDFGAQDDGGDGGGGDGGGGGGGLGAVGPSMTSSGGSTASQYVTSGFGPRNTGIAGASTNHGGIDIAGGPWQAGTAISVIKPGVVEETGDLGRSGWGRYVVVKHDDGTFSLYGHLSQINVKKGDKIENKSGEAKVIGKVGSTGVSNGPHLHFELGKGWNGTITGKVDPRGYVDSYIRGGGDVKVKQTDAPQVAAKPTASPTGVAAASSNAAPTPASKPRSGSGSGGKPSSNVAVLPNNTLAGKAVNQVVNSAIDSVTQFPVSPGAAFTNLWPSPLKN
jgi:murein DD-endopeptidase MepM/ murein hydrolase activator NlpD